MKVKGKFVQLWHLAEPIKAEIELSVEDLFKQLSIPDKFKLKENLDGWIDLPPTEPEKSTSACHSLHCSKCGKLFRISSTQKDYCECKPPKRIEELDIAKNSVANDVVKRVIITKLNELVRDNWKLHELIRAWNKEGR